MSFEFIDIHHSYGDREVLRGINLQAKPGDVTCLLGPSGCGKTTLLRLAAGINDVQAGQIRLEGEILAQAGNNPPPERRPVGLVFQEGALFPHMTVAENIGFGLSEADASSTINALLDQIGLSGYGDTYPHAMSGGQQQRVALARAMAPKPSVLLLDEPFASVDVVLRRSLREETRRLLKARNAVTLLVTHDPEEAMDIGDQIAVMEQGVIVQAGSPKDIYSQPASKAIACMFGGGQQISARRTDQGIQTPFGIWPIGALHSGSTNEVQLTLVARPDALKVAPAETGIKVEDVRAQGRFQRISLVNDQGLSLSADVSADQNLKPGDTVSVQPISGAIFGFDANR